MRVSAIKQDNCTAVFRGRVHKSIYSYVKMFEQDSLYSLNKKSMLENIMKNLEQKAQLILRSSELYTRNEAFADYLQLPRVIWLRNKKLKTRIPVTDLLVGQKDFEKAVNNMDSKSLNKLTIDKSIERLSEYVNNKGTINSKAIKWAKSILDTQKEAGYRKEFWADIKAALINKNRN